MTIETQLAQLGDLASSIERESIRRLFENASNPTPSKLLEGLAAYAASNDQFRGSNPALVNDLAHLLADDQDLLSRAFVEKRRIAEIAIELFVSAGYITKAATLAHAYRRATGKLYSLHSMAGIELLALGLSRELLWSLLIQDPETIAAVTDALGAAIRDPRTVVDEARFLSVAQALAQASQDVLFRAKPSYPARVMEGRAELLVELAVLTGQARLLRTAKRISAVVSHITRFATSYALGSGNSSLTARMLESLYGEASDCRIPILWPPQSNALRNGILSSPYYVVSAPTSSGKTFLAELKIGTYLDRKPDGLAVYVAPYNALAKQIGDAMSRRFRTAGIPAAIVWTGTYEIDYRELGSAAILVTTPEKLDGIVRSASEDNAAGLELMRRAGLFVFDELHLLSSHTRGVTYELLVTRLRRLFPGAEGLAMSAVCDNAAPLASWFAERHSAYTRDEWAPTRRRILIYKRSGELTSDDNTSQIELKKWNNAGTAAANIANHLMSGEAGPTLVLCTQIRYAIAIAEKLAALSGGSGTDPRLHAAAIELEAVLGPDSPLGSLVKQGIAYHYRGLPDRAKTIVERLAREKALECVCSTTTLAEGVHLPFRSLVIPYFHFGGSEFVNRSLLKNIIGRAGRAEANLRATIVFLEPGEGGIRTYFYDELIARLNEDIEVLSVLPTLGGQASSLEQFESTLRLESQILGVVQDHTFLEDQPTDFACATFGAQSHRGATLKLIVKKFEELEKREPPLLTRNSPYTLTAMGQATATSGISDSSARVLIRELDHLFTTEAPWFDFDSWVVRPLDSALIGNIATLIVTPFEFFQSTSHGQEHRMATIKRAREWYRHRNSGWIGLTTPDRLVFSEWIAGAELRDIFRDARAKGITAYPFDEENELLGIAHLKEYIEETREFGLWMLSAAIRLSEQYCRDLGIAPVPIFRKAVALLESGVSSDVALRLVGFGVPRELASKVAPNLFELADEDDDVFVPSARKAISELLRRDSSMRNVDEALILSALR